ncbi:MAG: hypothetical protein ACLFNU_04890 [Bacteroidales bacterium]
MKSRKEMRTPAKEIFAGADEMRKTRKLKPLKKEKNPKKVLYDEIDEFEDIDMNFLKDDFGDDFDDDDFDD